MSLASVYLNVYMKLLFVMNLICVALHTSVRLQ